MVHVNIVQDCVVMLAPMSGLQQPCFHAFEGSQTNLWHLLICT